jgi:hypothetical protein
MRRRWPRSRKKSGCSRCFRRRSGRFRSRAAARCRRRRPNVPPSSALGHREVPLLVIGDQQIGEEIAIEETGGINAYNFGVFQQRLEYLEERVLDILHHHQKAEFPELVVFLMGDNISGRIHEELQKYGHQHVIDQVYLGALTTALFLYRLQRFGRFQKIRVSCVSGNHGRLDKAKESKRYYKNFDYLFHSIVATTLKGVPEIEMFIPKSLFTVVDVAGVRILQSHGHELPPSSLGIPLYSVNRASAGYQELLSWSEAKRFDYWVLAHFHRPMELDGAIVNGTMAGLSEYGIGKFKPIRPMQKLIGFHSKYGKAWEYPVRLDFAPKTPKIYTFDAEMATPDAVALFGARQAQTNHDTRAAGRRRSGGHAKRAPRYRQQPRPTGWSRCHGSKPRTGRRRQSQSHKTRAADVPAFAADVERQLLGGAAGKKGYNVGGADAKNPLYEFVLGTTGDHGHAMGECIYKIVRYQKRRNPEDVLKAAAWLFLIYRYHQERR